MSEELETDNREERRDKKESGASTASSYPVYPGFSLLDHYKDWSTRKKIAEQVLELNNIEIIPDVPEALMKKLRKRSAERVQSKIIAEAEPYERAKEDPFQGLSPQERAALRKKRQEEHKAQRARRKPTPPLE